MRRASSAPSSETMPKVASLRSPTGAFRLADPPHAALDLEPRLLGLVREQVELLETRLEAELAERVGDDVRGARHLRRAGGPRTDADGERFDEVHARECKGPPAE